MRTLGLILAAASLCVADDDALQVDRASISLLDLSMLVLVLSSAFAVYCHCWADSACVAARGRFLQRMV